LTVTTHFIDEDFIPHEYVLDAIEIIEEKNSVNTAYALR